MAVWGRLSVKILQAIGRLRAHEDTHADAAWMHRSAQAGGLSQSKFMDAAALMFVLCSCTGLFLLIWSSGVRAGTREAASTAGEPSLIPERRISNLERCDY
jgi:hypothetical protein